MSTTVRLLERGGRILLGILGSVVVGVVVYYHVQAPSADELASLKETGSRLVNELEEHKKKHGVYPQSLPSTRSHGGRFGAWNYECIAGCQEFVLEMGHYPRYFFVLWYDSRQRMWRVDT
jgi:hypothetical protein